MSRLIRSAVFAAARRLPLVLGAVAVLSSGGATFPTPALQWRIPTSPVVSRFEVQKLVGMIWTPVATVDLTACAGSRHLWSCGWLLPDKDARYRLRACNAATCGPWQEEANLSCVLNGGSGCPCGSLPSPTGCIP